MLLSKYDLDRIEHDLTAIREDYASVEDIVADTLRDTGLTISDMRMRVRVSRIAKLRKILMARLYLETDMSTTDVADYLCRDHSTVVHALKGYER